MKDYNMTKPGESLIRAVESGEEADPYGFLCEATVISGPVPFTTNGVTGYSVRADNGRTYTARWNYEQALRKRERVQLIHDDDGYYTIEPIVVD